MQKTTKPFQPLSELRVYQILQLGKQFGEFAESFGFYAESLTLDEYNELYPFMEFLDEVGGCGPINIQELWHAYKVPCRETLKVVDYWKAEFAKYKQFTVAEIQNNQNV